MHGDKTLHCLHVGLQYSLSMDFRGHSHVKSSHSLCQTDKSERVGLAFWRQDLTNKILIFVKLLIILNYFFLKEKNINSYKDKPENPFKIVKNLDCLHDVTFKI